MKTELHSCFILHKRPYRETSLLLDILSSEYGRVSLVARGTRSRASKNQHALYQPFQKLQVSWSGKGEMGTLNKIEFESLLPPLKDSFLLSAFYVNELVMRLLHKNEPHPELYAAYQNAITALAKSENEQPILRKFEKQLLQTLGYGLVLDHDVLSHTPIQADQDYAYQPDSGPFEYPAAGCSFPKISGSTLQAIEQDDYQKRKSLEEAKKLMRVLINTMLDNKPLASRDLYQSWLKQG